MILCYLVARNAIIQIIGIIALTSLFLIPSHAQSIRNGAWFIPSFHAVKRINGLAIGPAMDLFDCCEENEKQVVNGIQFEIIGKGLIPPILYYNSEAWDLYKDIELVHHKINGIAISPGGVVGLGTAVNGINLSGLSTETSKINGISMALLLSMNQRVNGIAICGINMVEKMNGLQIGLFNNTKNLKGVQIGLWNKSEKRALPFLNFQF